MIPGTICHSLYSEVLVIVRDTRLLLLISCYTFPASMFYVLYVIFHIWLVKRKGNSLSTELHCETKVWKSWILAVSFLCASLFVAPIGTVIWEANLITNTTNSLYSRGQLKPGLQIFMIDIHVASISRVKTSLEFCWFTQIEDIVVQFFKQGICKLI